MTPIARRGGLIAIASTLLLTTAVTTLTRAADPVVQRVSIDSGSGRDLPSMSGNGTHVVFAGRGAANQGIWLRDTTLNQNFRLTTGTDVNPTISGDGNKVAFVRVGTTRAVWIMDVTNPAVPGTPVQVDRANGADGAFSNGSSDYPSLDEDGSMVVFQSTATNLTPATPLPVTGGVSKVYLRNITANTTTMVSADNDGVAIAGAATRPDISHNGLYVAFASEQAFVAPPAGTATYQQVYVKTIVAGNATGAVRAASTVNATATTTGNGASGVGSGPTISNDGNRVAFESDASNLVDFDTNGATDSFVHDLTSSATLRVSERSPISGQTGAYTALTGRRLLDTRDGNDPLGPGATRSIMIKGLTDVPSTATSVVLNVTAVLPSADGYLTVFPAGTTRPTTSSITVRRLVTAGNAVHAKIGADGSISIYNANGLTNVVVDLMGVYDGAKVVSEPVPGTGGGGFTPIVPTRILDTRTVVGGAITADKAVPVKVKGLAGVPDNATAVVLKLVAVQPTADGFLSVYPVGETRPVLSSLNFQAGQTVGNSVIAELNPGQDSVNVYNANGTTNVVIDVSGYWSPTARNGGFTPIQPVRAYDSRTSTALGAGGSVELNMLKVGDVPLYGVQSVVLNVTAVNPTSDGYLTVWPTGRTRPLAAAVNAKKGLVRSDQVIVPVGANGKVSIYNANGTTNVVVDVVGWWSGAQVSDGGTAPAISGDGTAVAFQSKDLLAPLDTNGTGDVFLRTISTLVTARMSVAVTGGTEATGTRVDSDTGLTVAQVNGSDPMLGDSAQFVVFSSNGDLAKDKPLVAGVPSTEWAVFRADNGVPG
jgi:Tol biopolymer transport system component